MYELQPGESTLIGKWEWVEGKLVANSVAKRIDYLVSHNLKEIGQRNGGWDILYRDPKDGRFWELTYPDSHMQGGGPPRLSCLSPQQVSELYGYVGP
jgi:hypothetical protein